MNALLNLADVPEVNAALLGIPMRKLIDRGQGLALLNGLDETEIRDLETEVWADFEGSDNDRLAVALRFRALLNVFSSRRLKDLLMQRGFRVIAAAIEEAAGQRFNVRFGFKAQAFVTALEAATARPAPRMAARADLRAAA